jgi:hypothetical protein
MALKAQVNFFDWVAHTYNALIDLGHEVKFRSHPNVGPHLLKRHGMRAKKWQRNVVHADEEMLYRGLHKALEEGMDVQTGKQSLSEALEAAQSVVTFNSNSGVDAVLSGCPTYAADPGSMAYDMTSRQLGAIVTPDREAWARWLSWCQFTRDELESGEAWEHCCPPHLR